ncbi:MAG: SRPBCC domain-containing protein [Phycisphaerales bacterium]|nr:SRPBCC domain-containing protein [Phycisphaerales bacterium]
MYAQDELTEKLTLDIVKEIEIDAPVSVAFDALLEQLGPLNARPDGEPLPMKLEPWPGGRWYRDLDNSNGHFWGHVQVIKRPTLLEITGPLFMSYAAISHVQYRLTPQGDATHLALRHQALGCVIQEHRDGVAHGWQRLLEQIRHQAQA